jgi:translation initiation factor 2B subunit (eIF-2B alpha/beta/delta family)
MTKNLFMHTCGAQGGSTCALAAASAPKFILFAEMLKFSQKYVFSMNKICEGV